MKVSSSQLKSEVRRLNQAQKELIATQESLKVTNEKSKENLEKFKKLSHNLEVMGKDSAVKYYNNNYYH